MPLTPDRLREIVVELVSRPGHEKVRALVYELLVHGLGASSSEVRFEQPVPEVHGRLDALLGRTVFELKSDLRRERGDAEEGLSRYLADRERATSEHFVGIATDGAEFVPYELRRGDLQPLPSYQPTRDDPRALLAWLEGVVTLHAELRPDPETVRRELGRGSLAFAISRARLAELWAEVRGQPEARLKRQLWADLLSRVYGADVDSDDLFFQHTYLTIVAKTMATRVLGIDLPPPADLLSGRSFQEAGVAGVVESDFFDWVLASDGSVDVIGRLARQVARFRLQDVEHDVLKGLYESLIDPEQRHELGEYYTPDWLAARIVCHVITQPLEQRVLDPACGSGTFLFHAVRRFLAAAEGGGLDNGEALSRCCRLVLGVDVHPVAVQIARVTYLLALGEERLRDHPPLAIPVYLGDSLQWNTRAFMAERDVVIEVPGGGSLLEFPFSIARDPGRFDAVIERMLRLSGENAPREALEAWLRREHPVDARTAATLAATYERLRALHRDGRDHIWGFVARNLVRPVWLSQEDQRADVVLGNPPWLSYRYMSTGMRERFREESQRRGLWVGQVAQQQDLSAYFFARCVELYLRPEGCIAFVMPYAAMTRRQYARFRSGVFGETGRRRAGQVFAAVQFTEGWAFSERVSPLFPVPSCVLFAQHEREAAAGTVAPRLPRTIQSASGNLPRRDATPEEAAQWLAWREEPWPAGREGAPPASPYGAQFRAGAVIFPSIFFRVEPAAAGKLGGNPDAPLVQSRRTNLEKRPWKELPPLRGNVEARFLRPLYLGESVAPYRVLSPILAVIPWEAPNGLMDAEAAQGLGYPLLARWLAEATTLWEQHGPARRSLVQQLDYYGQLLAQLPPPPVRVVYSASGTLPAAALLTDGSAICEHALYWAAPESETLRARAERFQSRGQWGARHFDKVLFELAIPAFDPRQALHRDLAAAAERAEQVAGAVPLREGLHFVRARGLIRDALREDGVAQRIDALVAELLGP